MEVPSKKEFLQTSQAAVSPNRSRHQDYNLGPNDYGVYDDAATYYNSEARHGARNHNRTRTYSQVRPAYMLKPGRKTPLANSNRMA